MMIMLLLLLLLLTVIVNDMIMIVTFKVLPGAGPPACPCAASEFMEALGKISKYYRYIYFRCRFFLCRYELVIHIVLQPLIHGGARKNPQGLSHTLFLSLIYIYIYICIYTYLYFFSFFQFLQFICVFLFCIFFFHLKQIDLISFLYFPFLLDPRVCGKVELCEPFPCEAAAETGRALQPLIWSFRCQLSYMYSSPEECFFHRHRRYFANLSFMEAPNVQRH